MLGSLEHNRGNLSKSLEYYQKSLFYADSSKFEFGKVWTLVGIGRVYSKLGKVDKASEFLELAEKHAKHIHASEALFEVYKAKKNLFAAQKKFEESLRYSELAFNLNDSIHRFEIARRFANLQHMDEIRARDLNIKTLTQDKLLAQNKIAFQELKLKQQYSFILFAPD